MRISSPRTDAWTAIIDALQAAGLLVGVTGSNVLNVTHVTQDSRQARPGSVFVAIKGQWEDGHAFIGRAVQSGAAAIVCEHMPEECHAKNAAIVRVSNTRKALATLASELSGKAHEHLKLYGITGTNGKTTTSYLLHHVLSILSGKTGLCSTITYQWGDKQEEPSLTTPDALKLHTLMRQMVDAGCANCVMEVSSHALKQDRVWGLAYRGAVFTNLTHDHLDYHLTWSDYRAAKRRLFSDLPASATAVYNADDPVGEWMVANTAADRISFGTDSGADIRFRVVDDDLTGLRLMMDGRECSSTLAGHFNGYNLAAAYAIARSAGFAPSDIIDALGGCAQVPGRFEWMKCKDTTTAVVDYAHTPDALEKVLQALKAMKPPGAALWCVFGCGGDRDRGKRPAMGCAAEAAADNVIVTSDNARTEAQSQIFEDIAEGMSCPEAAQWQEDRMLAVRTAILSAAPGDVILVAGRGHEVLQRQQAATQVLEDRKIVQHALLERESTCSTI